jgi:phage/plasmid-like protein (TIGR03299 family)
MIDGEIVYTPVSAWDVNNGFVIRRDDNGFPLNVGVTEGRGITQYDEMDAAVEKLIEQGFSPGVASKGTLNHGRKAYVTLEMGEPLDIEGYSKIHKYFTLTDAHDGTIAASGRPTLGVVVCANTFAAYILGVKASWSVKHTRNASSYLEWAIDSFVEAAKLQQHLDAQVERLINESYAVGDFSQLTGNLLGTRPEDEGRSQTSWDKTFSNIIARYWHDDLDGGIRETKWGALMAVQGYEQHVQQVRGGSKEGRHLDRLLFGSMPLTEKAIGQLVTSD